MAKGATAVYALTEQGAALGDALAQGLGATLFLPRALAQGYAAEPFDRLADQVAAGFSRFRRHVFICATGIVVRLTAPLLVAKDRDPAVVVLDQEGRYVVSLVAGHLGGANALAREVAALTGGRAVITTATDTAGLPAPDLLAQAAGCAFKDLAKVKVVSRALLAGERVQLLDPAGWLEQTAWRDRRPEAFEVLREPAAWQGHRPGILVTHAADCLGLDQGSCLVLRPPSLCLGLGCRKGVPAGELLDFVAREFRAGNLSLDSLWKLGTAAAKQDDPGLAEAARRLDRELMFFGKDELNAMDAPHPSPGALRHLGVENVCEAAAMLLAGTRELLIPKRKTNRATLAVALRGP